MVSHHPAKFTDDRHYGSGDLMFLVVEKQDFTLFHLNMLLLFISKEHEMSFSRIGNFRPYT